MRSDLPTGTVTFLFTDVEGSTSLLRELGAEAYADALAEHRRVVREACAAKGGVEVDTQGDAFFFAFPSAPGAAAAAQAITDALEPGPISLRIGLHTGTPLVTDEGYVGDDVHFAARVAASGHGGQVLLSKSARELVDGLSVTDLGEHRLKDIEGAVSIYQLGDETFPPLKTISNTNLPRPASSFIGREREREDVVRELRDGARLLTLTGPGGSGKTRLALEAASELVPAYKAGVFWVGLAALRESSLVTETISQTLGAKDGLAAHIGEREMLLLLDNLEQVIEAAPELVGPPHRLSEPDPALHEPRAPPRQRRGGVPRASTRFVRGGRRSSASALGLSPPRRSLSSAPASTTSRSRSSSPLPAPRHSRPRTSWSASPNDSTC